MRRGATPACRPEFMPASSRYSTAPPVRLPVIEARGSYMGAIDCSVTSWSPQKSPSWALCGSHSPQ